MTGSYDDRLTRNELLLEHKLETTEATGQTKTEKLTVPSTRAVLQAGGGSVPPLHLSI